MPDNTASTSVALVDRVADILEVLAQDETELGISEMSRKLGLGKSTVHRLVTKLVKRGYLQQNPLNQKYTLGPTMLRLGLVASQRTQDLRNLALPLMEQLRDYTNETVTLSIKSDQQRIYLYQVASRQEIRQTVDVGRAHPLYLGGSSKAILAFLPVTQRETILAEASKDKRVNLPKLIQELEEIKQVGYASSREERIRDAASIAAPLYDYTGQVVGAMSVAGPVSRLTQVKQLSFAAPLLETTRELSQRLGAPLKILMQPSWSTVHTLVEESRTESEKITL